MSDEIANQNQGTKVAIRVDIAFNLEQKVKAIKGDLNNSFIELAKILYEVKEQGYYKELGYNTIAEWLSSPEISLGVRWAWYLTEIYEQFILKSGLDKTKIGEVDVSKLIDILPVIKKKPEEIDKWVEAAKTLRTVDLRREIQSSNMADRQKNLEQIISSGLADSSPEVKMSDFINESSAVADGIAKLAIVSAPNTPDDKDPFSYHFGWVSEVKRVLSTDGNLFVLCNDKNLPEILYTMAKISFPLLRDIIWKFKISSGDMRVGSIARAHQVILFASKSEKPHLNLLDVESDVWEADMIDSYTPPALYEKIISIASDPGDMVFDPFAGNGRILETAKRLGRKCYGTESDPEKFQECLNKLS